jgi:hypothetical protein
MAGRRRIVQAEFEPPVQMDDQITAFSGFLFSTDRRTVVYTSTRLDVTLRVYKWRW